MYRFPLLRLFIFFTSFLTSLPSTIFSFEPAEYVSATDKRLVFFMEGKSLQSFTKNLESFYLSLRENAESKKVEWDFLVQFLNSKVGFDLFDQKESKKVGIDRRYKFAVMLYKATQRENGGTQFLIPTSNSKKFYNWFKNRISKEINKGSQPTIKIKELKKESLLEISYKREKFYLAKSSKHISIGNRKAIAIKGTKTPKKSLVDSEHYKLFRKLAKKSKGHQANFFTTSDIFLSLRGFSWLPFFRLNTPNTKIILDNTRLVYGEIVIHSGSFIISLQHVLQKDFFKKNDKTLIDFQIDFISTPKNSKPLKAGALKLDQNKEKNILHLTSLFNPKYIWSYLNQIPYLNLAKLLPNNPIFSLKKLFKSSLRGNISIIIRKPLSDGLPTTLHDTDFIASVGLQETHEKDSVQSRLENLIKTRLKKYSIQFTKERYKDKYDVWQISWNKKKKNKIIAKRKLYVMFHENELSISSNKENIKKIFESSKNNIIDENKNILSENSQETSGLILLDVNQVYNFIRQSSLGILFPQYIDYIKEVKNLILHSFYRDDTIFSEFKVILK